EARLEVRLVETRKELVPVGRYQQGIQVVLVGGGIRVANDAGSRGADVRHERERHARTSIPQERCGDVHVRAVVGTAGGNVLPADRHTGESSAAEVQDYVMAASPREVHGHPPDGTVTRRDIQMERVGDVAQMAGAPHGKLA